MADPATLEFIGRLLDRFGSIEDQIGVLIGMVTRLDGAVRDLTVQADARAPLTPKILTKRQLAQRMGRSVRHLERLIGEGEGPPLVQLGVRAVGINEGDAEAWIASRRRTPPGWNNKP